MGKQHTADGRKAPSKWRKDPPANGKRKGSDLDWLSRVLGLGVFHSLINKMAELGLLGCLQEERDERKMKERREMREMREMSERGER